MKIIRQFYLEAQAYKNSPSNNNPPRGIKPDAIPIWKAVIKKYKKEVHKAKDLKTQWAVAVSLFKTFCVQKGIMPFDFEKLTKQKQQSLDEDLYKKAKKGAKNGRKFITNLLKDLARDEFIDKSLSSRWVFDKAIFADGRFHIAAYKRLRVGWESSGKELLQELALSYQFSKDPKAAFRTLDSLTTISFEISNKPGDKRNQRIVYVYVTLSFTKKQAEELTAQESVVKIHTKLNKLGKGLVL